LGGSTLRRGGEGDVKVYNLLGLGKLLGVIKKGKKPNAIARGDAEKKKKWFARRHCARGGGEVER